MSDGILASSASSPAADAEPLPMSASAPDPVVPAASLDHAFDPQTIGDLLERLGEVSPSRVRLHPWPGTATEADVIAIEAKENRLFELIDGVLVEKGIGYTESRWALILGDFLQAYLETHDLGIIAGADGMLRIPFHRVRMPDVSFISWARIPDPTILEKPIPDIVPDMAVEFLSPSNTKREMEMKLREYFAAGVRLVWYVDPPPEQPASSPRPRPGTTWDRTTRSTAETSCPDSAWSCETGSTAKGREVSRKEARQTAFSRSPGSPAPQPSLSRSVR